MGAVKSKSAQRPTKQAKISKKEYSLPQDEVVYRGPQVQYQVIDTPVTMQNNLSVGFTAGQTMISTNIDSYYGILCQPYNDGYKMKTFYRIPGAQQMGGFFSMNVNIPYQGIFTRHPAVTSSERWRLKVVKTMMQVQGMRMGIYTMETQTVGDTSHIHQVIMENSANGGRLICLELTGQVVAQGMNMAMAGFSSQMGVDAFFDMPLHPNPKLYTYQAVNVCVNVNVSMGFPSPTIQVQCDWLGHMAAYLHKGWKLVETFLDQTNQMRGGGFTSSMALNSIWFFEKETSKLQDDTPKYEGTVVDYSHKISAGFTGSNVRTNWVPLLQEMGQQGWQLASIMETPETTMSGIGTITMKLLFFFQRLLVPDVPEAAGYSLPSASGYGPATEAPPQYDSVFPEKPPLK